MREKGTKLQLLIPVSEIDRSHKLKEEPSDKVCQVVDTPASFESDTRKHFGFAVSRYEKVGLECWVFP